MGFKEIKPCELAGNVFDTIGNKWMAVTVKDGEKINAMTASWGAMGCNWGKEVVLLVIRPQRYTKQMLDSVSELTVCILPEKDRDALAYFGKASGKDEDKIANSHLGVTLDGDMAYFDDSEVVFELKTLYVQQQEAQHFKDKDIIDKWYPNSDFHYMYIAEITKVLVRE